MLRTLTISTRLSLVASANSGPMLFRVWTFRYLSRLRRVVAPLHYILEELTRDSQAFTAILPAVLTERAKYGFLKGEPSYLITNSVTGLDRKQRCGFSWYIRHSGWWPGKLQGDQYTCTNEAVVSQGQTLLVVLTWQFWSLLATSVHGIDWLQVCAWQAGETRILRERGEFVNQIFDVVRQNGGATSSFIELCFASVACGQITHLYHRYRSYLGGCYYSVTCSQFINIYH